MDIDIEVDVDGEVDVEKVNDGDGHDFQTGGCTPDKDDKAFAGFDIDANSASKEAGNFGIFSAFNKSSDDEKAAADKNVSSTPVLDEDSASSVMDGGSNLDPAFVQENDTGSVPRESEQAQIANDRNTMVPVGSEVDRISSPYVTEPESLVHAEKDIDVSPVAQSDVTEPETLVHAEKDIDVSPVAQSDVTEPDALVHAEKDIDVSPVAQSDVTETEALVHAEKDIDVSPVAQSEVNCTNDSSSFTPSEVVPGVTPHAQLGTGDGGGDSHLTQPAMNAASYQSPVDPESNSSDVPAVTEPEAYGDCVVRLAQPEVLHDSEGCNEVGATVSESGQSQQYDSVPAGADAMPQCEDNMDVDLEPSHLSSAE
ncbi:hypothetical protein PR048_028858 [Dryococelus australis]|uniref:Uncharacterized protein n=1 Tax=Dryococelus australis TaxID=614101 RepID=A0ABQ9GFF3_9NEOP|nr:hypothetical protein PR048_028858 [Dryococelus australis]